ncbi:MFS transporter [Streptomyces sp. NPDC050485]|uniref:MFS transporter n=1 Tax=Streptomyces sp. NPDC050485 TaxID=3365617 RepID=UPI0037A2C511
MTNHPASDTTTPSDADTSPELPAEENQILAALRSTSMRAPLFWSVVGRFPFYLVGLALVVFTTSKDTGYLSAGLFLGAYSLGTALFAPLVARRVDRYGQTIVLLATGLVYPVSLIGFVAFQSGSMAVQLACVAVAGATVPPISGCIRTLWRGTEGLEPAGISLESVLFNVFLIGGPLLLSVMLLLASPGAAIVIGGVLAAAGSIGFATTRASRTQPATLSGARDPLGALRSEGLILVLALVACTAVRTGIYNVALPAFADDHGSASGVGVFYAAWGVGGILGGLWYGSRSRRWSVQVSLRVGMVVVSAGALLPVLVWDNWSMGLALVVLGSFEAPMTVILYKIISRTARATHVTEAFTWSSTISLGGSALGAQIGGLLLTSPGTQMAFLCAFTVLLVAVTIAFTTRHRLAKAL